MRRASALGLLALTLAALGGVKASALDSKGRPRMLIVVASSSSSPALARQTRWLRAADQGLQDRDVLVIRIAGSASLEPLPLNLDAQKLRRSVPVGRDGFGVALIGKDGSQALHKDHPITMASLFQAIDAMPMRRQEMRRRTSP